MLFLDEWTQISFQFPHSGLKSKYNHINQSDYHICVRHPCDRRMNCHLSDKTVFHMYHYNICDMEYVRLYDILWSNPYIAHSYTLKKTQFQLKLRMQGSHKAQLLHMYY
jgi:hypothetical protein